MQMHICSEGMHATESPYQLVLVIYIYIYMWWQPAASQPLRGHRVIQYHSVAYVLVCNLARSAYLHSWCSQESSDISLSQYQTIKVWHPTGML